MGARDFLDVNASTTREMMYGSILYTTLGMFMFSRKSKPEYTLPSARQKPNSSAARAIFRGCHAPKIMTASARKPKPATPFSNFHTLTPAVMYTMPPRPPSSPESSTPA